MSCRGKAANLAAVVGTGTRDVGNTGFTYSTCPILQDDDAQPVGRYVGAYMAYGTGLYKVKNTAAQHHSFRCSERLLHLFKHAVLPWPAVGLHLSCLFALNDVTLFLNTRGEISWVRTHRIESVADYDMMRRSTVTE